MAKYYCRGFMYHKIAKMFPIDICYFNCGAVRIDNYKAWMFMVTIGQRPHGESAQAVYDVVDYSLAYILATLLAWNSFCYCHLF